MLCDDLEVWDGGGGKETKEKIQKGNKINKQKKERQNQSVTAQLVEWTN